MFDRHSLSPIDYCICLLWKRVFSRWICALSFLHFWCHSFLFILPVQKTRFPVLTWRHVFSFTNSRIRLRKLAPPRRPTTSANQSLGPIFQVFAVAMLLQLQNLNDHGNLKNDIVQFYPSSCRPVWIPGSLATIRLSLGGKPCTQQTSTSDIPLYARIREGWWQVETKSRIQQVQWHKDIAMKVPGLRTIADTAPSNLDSKKCGRQHSKSLPW